MDLHKKFVKLAVQRKTLYYELISILPEIYESGVWKKYSTDICEYAGKYGGISKSAVETRLNLEKHLTGKPLLKAAIAKVGVNKVKLVATLATPETDAIYADKVEHMSKGSLIEMTKELRSKQEVKLEHKNLELFESEESEINNTSHSDYRNICKAVPCKTSVMLDSDGTFLLLKLKQRLEKQHKIKMSNRELLHSLMQEKLESLDAKNPGTGTSESSTKNSSTGTSSNKPQSRHIPIAQKREIINKTDGQCTYGNCNRPGEELHHKERFMNSRNHSSLTFLCKIHHEFMHNGLIQEERGDPRNWRLVLSSNDLQKADKLYRRYKKRL